MIPTAFAAISNSSVLAFAFCLTCFVFTAIVCTQSVDAANSEPTLKTMSGTIFESRLKEDTDDDTKHPAPKTSGSRRKSSLDRKSRSCSDEKVGTVNDGKRLPVSLKTRPVVAGVKHAQNSKQTELTRTKATDTHTVEEVDEDAGGGSGNQISSDTDSKSASASKTVAVVERHKRETRKPKIYSPGNFTKKRKRAKLIHDDVYVT